jgi:ActR/RegA family two-component response regulator
MAPPVRILFVDDEPGILTTMSEILRQHGFEVATASRVDEALAAITSAHFHVLISDLNIGQPGDGFVVVSAMRRTQPDCVTLILTGFPGFETALEAIRSQVDDYLIKPTPIPTLVSLIERKLKNRQPGKAAGTKRIADILREHIFEITRRALEEMKADPSLGKLSLAEEERIEHIPQLLADLAVRLEPAEPRRDEPVSTHGAEACGRKRYRMGYTAPLLITQMRLLERAIYDVIHENLLSMNLSHFMLDLKRLNDTLGVQLEHTFKAYLEAERRSVPQEDPGQTRP